MNNVKFILMGCCLLAVMSSPAQTIKLDKKRLETSNVFISAGHLHGKEAIKIVKDSVLKEVDEPTFAKLKEIHFQNGIIEVKVLSRLLPGAPDLARGFIGVAFRINDSNSKFECIYIRPANGRANIQLRRNHSTQYFSYPDYKFDRLRKEAPGEYESYADMGLNEWIKLKIEVKGARANLFINDSKEPSLIINDLKHGANSSGGIGLWVDIGTEGFFTDLKVYK